MGSPAHLEKSGQDDRRFFGKYRGFVYQNNDPQKLGRLRAIVPEILGDKLPTDWAWPCVQAYGGAFDNGMAYVPEEGAGVWIEFEGGKVDRPVWVGVFWATPSNGEPEYPRLARGVRDDSLTAKQVGTLKSNIQQFRKKDGYSVDFEANRDDPLVIEEPKTTFATVYPHNKVIKTKSGHVIEYDDTPKAERIRFFHSIGSYLEFKQDGSIVTKAHGNSHDWVESDKYQMVGGSLVTVIGRSEVFSITGDSTRVVQGLTRLEYHGGLEQVIGTTYNVYVNGDMEIEMVGNSKMKSSGAMSQSSSSAMNQSVGGAMEVRIQESKNETIVNAGTSGAGPAQPHARQIEILNGGSILKAHVGPLEWETEIGLIRLETMAGNITATTAVGDVLVETQLGQMTLRSTTLCLVDNQTSIKLGSNSASEQAVLGNMLNTFFQNMMLLFDTHSHPVSGSSTGPPTPLWTPVLTPQLTNHLSNVVRLI